MILDAADTTFRIHGLVQAVERVRAEADDAAEEARDRALTQLTALFPNAYNDPEQWPLCRLFLPHQRALLTRPFPDRATDRAATLLNLAGNFLRGSADAAGALPLYRRALDISERVLGKEHPQTLTSMNNLALCLQALGDAAGASALYRRAADGFDALFGPDHPTSRRVRANYDRLEREIAGQTTGRTPAENGEMGLG